MHHKLFTLAIVLLLAGLAPATSIIGFCARMPCCAHAPADSPALTTERAGCCTTITCYESPSAKLTTAARASLTVISMPALISAPGILPAPAIGTALPIDSSPPRTARDRLAALSVFLI